MIFLYLKKFVRYFTYRKVLSAITPTDINPKITTRFFILEFSFFNASSLTIKLASSDLIYATWSATFYTDNSTGFKFFFVTIEL